VTSWRLHEAFRTYDVPYQVCLESNSTLTICAMVSQVGAVALIDPFTLTTNAFPGLVSRAFRPKLPVVPRFLFSPKRPKSLVVAQFVETIRACARQLLAQGLKTD
jgi:DNA-binding transcriptional LysR family regulator